LYGYIYLMKKSMVPRTLGEKLLSLTGMFPVISLTGPRQSGKTTLCRALFPDYAYVNLENLDDRMAAEEDPLRFLKQHSKSGVIIDEAQKAPPLFSWLQGIVDESGQMGKYILTGSQNFLLLEKISQSLAGRVAVCHLMPFGFDELMNAGLAASDADHAMFTGGYPPLYDRHIPPADFFPSYIQTYIERDVRNISNIVNLSTFQRFVKLCAGRVGQLLNFSSLGNELGVDYKTIRSWISILEAGFMLVFGRMPFSGETAPAMKLISFWKKGINYGPLRSNRVKPLMTISSKVLNTLNAYRHHRMSISG
jgi:uncharacterized protein